MRRSLATGALTLVIFGATVAPAAAAPARPRPPQPITPPGVEETRQDDNAAPPTTGSSNKANSPVF
jgi:hypothetical protein